MERCYEDKNFKPTHLDTIFAAERELRSYAEQGYTVTLRQLYYRFVSADLFPSDRFFRWTGSKYVSARRDEPGATNNADPNYKWLGGLITDGRRAGLIDWDFLEDRNRNLQGWHSDRNPAATIRSAAARYRLDHWADQDVIVEVWVEKDALSSVIERACRGTGTSFLACKGYMSASEMKATAERYGRYINGMGKTVKVLYLGDHDPSGIDMANVNRRQIQEMLDVDSIEDGWGEEFYPDADDRFEFRRIALNMDQVRVLNPPPNPAKLTDSRAKGYIERFGRESWELDAIPPDQMVTLIEEAIQAEIDQSAWDDTSAQQAEHRELMDLVSANWAQVSSYVRGL